MLTKSTLTMRRDELNNILEMAAAFDTTKSGSAKEAYQAIQKEIKENRAILQGVEQIIITEK